MKIKLEYPFDVLYGKGYLVTNKENRKHVILYNSKHDRTTISFARYIMSCKLKKILDKGIEVDHIDNDKTNDTSNNLQLLTKSDNIKKSSKPATLNTFVCPICNKIFELTKQRSHRKNPCCSRKCGGIKSTIKT